MADYSYLKGLSSSELEKRASQNSADWHTDVGQRSNYEAENKAIKAELDKRYGITSTLDTTTGKWTSVSKAQSAAGAQQQTIPVQQETVPLQQQSSYDLTEYLKQQEAAKVESTLAGLKGAYEQSMAGYKAEKANLPKTYDAARNSTAAQSARAQRTFDERAAAQGLSSGAAGQAALARSSALTGALSQIDQAQAGAEADIDLQMANLKNQYETAIQQAKANGNSQLATALYQEMVRMQGLQRQDEQLAYNRAQSEDATRYNREQAEKAEAQERINAYLAVLGQVSGLDSALVEQSGYTPTELTALEQYYAQQKAASTKPTLTASQVDSAIKAGNLTPNVLSAYEYYYGVPYGSAGGVSGTVSMSRSSGSGSYDNGSLTTEQVMSLQRFMGLEADGRWFRSAAGGMSADEAWKVYSQIQNIAASRQDNYTVLESELGEMFASGTSVDIINSALAEARNEGLISRDEYFELRKEYRKKREESGREGDNDGAERN